MIHQSLINYFNCVNNFAYKLVSGTYNFIVSQVDQLAKKCFGDRKLEKGKVGLDPKRITKKEKGTVLAEKTLNPIIHSNPLSQVEAATLAKNTERIFEPRNIPPKDLFWEEIKKGNFNHKSKNGLDTIVKFFAKYNEELCQDEVLKGILSRCDINTKGKLIEKDFYENTAILWAIANANYVSALYLLKYCIKKGIKIDLSVQDNLDKNTALLLILKKGNRLENKNDTITWFEIVKLLIEQSDEKTLKLKDNNGNTALHIACFRREKEIVQLLKAKNTKLKDERNNKGQLPKALWDLKLDSNKNKRDLDLKILKYSDGTVTFDVKEREQQRKYDATFP